MRTEAFMHVQTYYSINIKVFVETLFLLWIYQQLINAVHTQELDSFQKSHLIKSA